jgi:hypothetical protein
MSEVCIVIGERIATPQALVHLVMKLRVSPPKSATTSEPNGKVDMENRPTIDADEEARLDNAFLNSPRDVEDLKSSTPILSSAHSPLWPSVCGLLLAPVFVTDTVTFRIRSPVGGLCLPMLKAIGSSSLHRKFLTCHCLIRLAREIIARTSSSSRRPLAQACSPGVSLW